MYCLWLTNHRQAGCLKKHVQSGLVHFGHISTCGEVKFSEVHLLEESEFIMLAQRVENVSSHISFLDVLYVLCLTVFGYYYLKAFARFNLSLLYVQCVLQIDFLRVLLALVFSDVRIPS